MENKNPAKIEDWVVLENDSQIQRVLLKTISEQRKFHRIQKANMLKKYGILNKIEKKNIKDRIDKEYVVPEITIIDYQKRELFGSIEYCNNFRTCIDIGANYGLMTYNLSKKFNEVHSFELVPSVRECLKQNVKNFNLDNVVVYDCGLGECEKDANFLFNSNKTLKTQITNSEYNGTAKIKTLDSFMLEQVDFIKLDCEGYEKYVLEGAIGTIKKCNPIILFENKGKDEIWGLDGSPVEYLKTLNYKLLIDYGKNCVMGPR